MKFDPSRREFLKKSLLVTGSGLFVPAFLRQAAWAAPAENDRFLVVIRLSGGNDGLNTVVPYRNDIYYRERPQIAVNQSDVLKLTDDQALHPALKNLHKQYERGNVGIFNSVGYPNPDRSHFRATDIWETASGADEYLQNGWLGRWLDADCAGDCRAHRAVQTSDSPALALKGLKVNGLAVGEPERFYESTRPAFVRDAAENRPAGINSEASFLYETLAETVQSADYIYEKLRADRQEKARDYPAGKLAKSLRNAARIMKAGIGTRVVYVPHSGFDTHAGQVGRHERLLKEYDEALEAFVQDLKTAGLFERTTILTFSEFGRRIAQNAGRGTDHGTANNLWVVGGNLKEAGIYNAPPDLENTDAGDLKFTIDFRRIYAEICDKVLLKPHREILGESYERPGFLL